MRGIGNHTPPADMQYEPNDATSAYVWTQIGVWVGTGRVVHTEIAREIAGQFASSVGRGALFTQFATMGEIPEEFIAAIVNEFDDFKAGRVSVHDDPSDVGNILALAALRAYVEESLETNDVDPNEDGPTKMQEEGYDARDEWIANAGSVMDDPYLTPTERAGY